MMDEQCKKKVIEKDTIKLLTPENLKRLQILQIKYSDTVIKVEQMVGRIIVRGYSEDLVHVISAIHEVLDGVKEAVHEQDRAEMVAKDVQWFYEERGVRVPYEKSTNAEIETAYNAKKLNVWLETDDGDYEINFQTMKESKISVFGDVDDGNDTGYVCKVFRKDLREGLYWNRFYYVYSL